MIMTWPKKTPGLADNAERFAAKVAALTSGKLKIKLFGAGEIVPAFESLDAVSGGTADMCHSTSAYWVGKHKAFNYFAGIPFGFTAQEMAAWIRFGGGQALWEEVYSGFGIQPFYAGSSGTQAGGWFRKEVNTPEDFHGLKFRIGGLGGEVLRRMGATTIMTPPGEIAPALLSGLVDGAEWIGPWNDLAFGLFRAAKYYYMPGFQEPGTGAEIIVNQRVYKSLDPDLRVAIQVAAAATAEETLADFTYHNVMALEPLLRDHDVQLRHFSDPIVRSMAGHAAEVVDDLGASDPITAKTHASFKAFLTKCRNYAPNAEGAFLNGRSRFA
jgi:TRAP-type mannitol/chloroaromatic compound transport system substrate-binding protein